MNDLISRTQAIDALKEKVFHNLSDEFYGAMQVLDELPSIQPETNCSEIPNNSDTISRQMAIDVLEERLQASGYSNVALVSELNRSIGYLMRLPSVQPESKAVFNRDIAIEAICDEVMLWFDISATKAYEIADTVVKRIEVRMEKTERGES